MPHEFHEDNWEDYNDRGWDETPSFLWDDLTDGSGWEDDYGKMLFEMVFVDPETADVRNVAFASLVEWMRDEYGIDFETEFDWEAWREWYG